MARVILVTSGKGGVGKTTTAVNLSHSLYTYGRRVVLLDLNFYSADITLHLGAFKVDRTLHDFVNGQAEVDDILYMHNSGLTFIPSSLSLKKSSDIDKDKVLDKVSNILDFLNDKTEVIIIDAGIIFVDYVSKLLDKVDDVILVTTPDKEAVVNTLKAVKIAEHKNTNILGVVVNKKQKHPIEMRKEEIESFVEKPVIIEIPHDEEVFYAQKLEFPVVHYKPDAESSVKFKELAAKIIGKKYVENEEKKEEQSLFKKVLIKLGLAK